MSQHNGFISTTGSKAYLIGNERTQLCAAIACDLTLPKDSVKHVIFTFHGIVVQPALCSRWHTVVTSNEFVCWAGDAASCHCNFWSILDSTALWSWDQLHCIWKASIACEASWWNGVGTGQYTYIYLSIINLSIDLLYANHSPCTPAVSFELSTFWAFFLFTHAWPGSGISSYFFNPLWRKFTVRLYYLLNGLCCTHSITWWCPSDDLVYIFPKRLNSVQLPPGLPACYKALCFCYPKLHRPQLLTLWCLLSVCCLPIVYLLSAYLLLCTLLFCSVYHSHASDATTITTCYPHLVWMSFCYA